MNIQQKITHPLLWFPLSLFSLAFSHAVAAETISTLSTVNVTSKQETAAPSSSTTPSLEVAKERMNRIAGGANVVDSNSYRSGRVSNLRDALAFSPGVFIQPRFGSDEARLSIRGSGLQRTFHMRGINMLQDGIPVNLADGGGDFQSLDPLNYDYIEVFRGANALQYGGTTLGGAINFVSRTGYTAPKYQLRMEGGSYGYLRAQASTADVKDNMDYFLSYTHTQQDGFRDHAKQNNHRVSGNLGFKINDQLETRFFAGYVDTDSELPGSLTKRENRETPRKRQSDPFSLSSDQARDFQLWRIGNKTTYTFGKNRVELNAFYSYKDLFHPIFMVIDQINHDYGGGARFVSEEDLFGQRNMFTAGITVQNGDTRDRRYVNRGGQSFGAAVNAYNQNALNLTVFLENQHYFTPQFVAVTGGSWTYAKRRLDDLMVRRNSFDEDFTKFTPKVGMRYEINDDAQIFANYSQSFEPPSFGELTGGQLITKVYDQRGHTAEIGSRGKYDKWNMEWDAAYYHTWIKNEMLSLSDSRGLPLGTVSADNTIHQGIELGLTNRFLDDRLTLRQSYMWNDFRFDNDKVYKNNRLAGVPEHFYRADLVYNWDQGFYFGPNVEWTPSKYAVDHANTFFADGYAIVGLKAGYKIKPYGLDLFVEGRNLNDARYTASTGVISNARGRDQNLFAPGDGATVYGGLQWHI